MTGLLRDVSHLRDVDILVLAEIGTPVQDLVPLLNEGVEQAYFGHRRTLVIGDFNMDPFERGLVSFDCFHAVMSRSTAQQRSRKVEGRERPFFYNPMWNHFGDHPPNPPGSFFRARSGRTEYFWHSFNQVLLRPDLLDFFEDEGLEVLTHIGEQSLVRRNGRPDPSTGSDHLPLLLELSIERGFPDGRTESVAEPEG